MGLANLFSSDEPRPLAGLTGQPRVVAAIALFNTSKDRLKSARGELERLTAIDENLRQRRGELCEALGLPRPEIGREDATALAREHRRAGNRRRAAAAARVHAGEPAPNLSATEAELERVRADIGLSQAYVRAFRKTDLASAQKSCDEAEQALVQCMRSCAASMRLPVTSITLSTGKIESIGVPQAFALRDLIGDVE